MVHMLEIVRQVGKVDFPQVIVSNFSKPFLLIKFTNHSKCDVKKIIKVQIFSEFISLSLNVRVWGKEKESGKIF